MDARTVGTVTIIGSGEMMEAMGKVHRAVMSRITGPVVPVFLDTPAGFQLNADDLSAKAIEYFRQRFDLPLTVASFKSAARATPADVSAALSALASANYIFAGPGSPTYAVRNWLRTPIHAALVNRFEAGAHLVFASAAAITLGRHMIPIYEIYKVGEEPRWVQGLNLLEPFGLDLAIVPHWNNAEGRNHDTRFCFMGAPRLNILESLLPPTSVILGADEYTACTVDLRAREFIVAGSGQVTIRHEGHEHCYSTGSYPLDGLQPRGAAGPLVRPPTRTRVASEDSAERLVRRANVARVDFTRALDASDFEAAVEEIGRLVEAMGESPISGAEASLPAQIQAMLGELLRVWRDSSRRAPARGDDAAGGPYLELLIGLRAKLRQSKQWALADEVRAGLHGLGITLEDNASATSWRQE
ncbi:MAG: hypothetical protein HY260_11250 [Chloroflexi bacterium]|nr:hypothetical protein [Chloroflexota bacterium]